MIYYLSKIFWLLAAPTSALVLISASAGLWAVLANSECAVWLAAAAACGLLIGTFTPIGLALTAPLENRFRLLRPDPRVPLDGIITLPGGAGDGVDAVSKFSQDYPKARLTFCGFSAADKKLMKRLADLGVDPARIHIEPRPRTTSEDAVYSAAARGICTAVVTSSHSSLDFGLSNAAEYTASSEVVRGRGSMSMRAESTPRSASLLINFLSAALNPQKARRALG